MEKNFSRVAITDKASLLLEELKEKHGEVVFHQSGGCCDGSMPMLLGKGDIFLNDTDVHLGKVCGVDYYMNQDQFKYWKHTHLTIDVTKGMGSSFSLEIPTGNRFLVKSRVLTEEEQQALSKEAS